MKNCNAREVIHISALCNMMSTKDFFIEQVDHDRIYFRNYKTGKVISLAKGCELGLAIPAPQREALDPTFTSHCSTCPRMDGHLNVNMKFNTDWLASVLSHNPEWTSPGTRQQLENHENSLLRALMAHHYRIVPTDKKTRSDFRTKKPVRLVSYPTAV